MEVTMRLRNVKGSRDTIEHNPFVIREPEALKGNWAEAFGNDHPIFIEVGMGKGKFLTELASLHPEFNFIGIEKYSSVLVRALEKQEELLLPNIKFLRLEAEHLNDIFDTDEVSGIYLNFSDPWPKDRHAKRRLTSRQFFDRYDRLLKPSGTICFKTDNKDLFDFSLKESEHTVFMIRELTYDLHHSEFAEGNIMTEYEERFSKKGNPIMRAVFQRKEA